MRKDSPLTGGGSSAFAGRGFPLHDLPEKLTPLLAPLYEAAVECQPGEELPEAGDANLVERKGESAKGQVAIRGTITGVGLN